MAFPSAQRGLLPAQRFWWRAWLLLGLALQMPLAGAIDLRPGEARAPIPGLSFVQLRWQESERGAYYRDDIRSPGTPKISTSTRLLRLGTSFTLGDSIAATYVEIPQGERRAEGAGPVSGSDSGLGDIAAAFAVWPYVDREARRYAGLAAYLIAPTGSYSGNRPINIGDNRYRGALQGALHGPLLGALEGMVAVDAMWSGDNDDTWPNRRARSQDTIYTAQGGVLYPLLPNLEVAAAYFFTVGGETRENGVPMNDALRLQRYQLSAQARLPSGLVVLQYGGDLATRNGYLEKNSLILRYTLFF